MHGKPILAEDTLHNPTRTDIPKSVNALAPSIKREEKKGKHI
jgi:hypothetical protein